MNRHLIPSGHSQLGIFEVYISLGGVFTLTLTLRGEFGDPKGLVFRHVHNAWGALGPARPFRTGKSFSLVDLS